MTTKPIAGTFVVEREVRINAPRERVFEILSSREGISVWMPVSVFEPWVGGRIEFRFLHRDREPVAFGEVTAFDPPSRLAFTWDFKDDPLDARTEVTIDVIADGTGSLVRLTHTGFVDEQEAGKHAEGWEYWIGRLKALGDGEDPGSDRSIDALRPAG